MKTYKNLWRDFCNYENLFLAFLKARKRKTLKPYVIEFEKDLRSNLLQLQVELLIHSYKPKPLETFIVRDPKTRKISKSDFRDRLVHHALCNIIEPLFDKIFIYDSYANRRGKGSLNALKRFDCFKRKVSKNNKRNIFILKADIKHYFDSVDHEILLNIIKNKIKDEKIIWLIKIILNNYYIKENGKGMPLGNLTSQFFANIYLNELDQFVKHNLKIKHYIRYVDDFVIFHQSKEKLEEYRKEINLFLNEKLNLQLHPDKSKIYILHQGTNFLGLKVFYYYRRIQKKNIEKFKRKLNLLCYNYDNNLLNYDKIYNFLEGWCAYSRNSNSFNFRRKFLGIIEEKFKHEISSKEVNRLLKSRQANSKSF